MLIRKLKCFECGSNKVTELQSMYIYCDYCGCWMGIDMTHAMNDAADAFSIANYKNKTQQDWLEAGKQMGEAAEVQDKEKSLEANLRMHALEFDLFPHRFGPKGKQPSFRQKYMEFYRLSIQEMMEKGDYFSGFVQKEEMKAAQGLHYTSVNGKMKYTFDNNFIVFIEYSERTVRNAIEKGKNYSSLKFHPEGAVVLNSDLMYSNSMANMLSVYDEETAKKIISHFKLDYDYIEIEPVNLSKMDCSVCRSELKVPDNSKTVICESCGSSNNVKEKTINCFNCGTSFSPSNGKAQCPSCGSLFHSIENMNEIIAAKNSSSESAPEKKEKKSFFRRLFGG